uniref:LysE family translocator n=1 Tax=Rodentolepis nana TaxID=102285 RepID=A0A0R3TJ02_RODNA
LLISVRGTPFATLLIRLGGTLFATLLIRLEARRPSQHC